MHTIVEFAREEMYEKVWAKPVLQVAKEIGVSDVAIAKACRRAAVPLPPRGYWAKPVAKRPKRPRLGQAPTTSEGPIKFSVFDPELTPQAQPKATKADGSALETGPIVIPGNWNAPHPLIAQALAQSKSGKVKEGRCVLERSLDIRVSPAQIDRALLYMDSLIRSTEALGARWSVTEKGTQLIYLEVEIPVTLRESLRREEIKESSPDLAPRRKGEWRPNALDLTTRIEFLSTGQLSLELNAWTDVPVRRNWKDTATTKIEDKLQDLLKCLPRTAQAVKDRMDRWARETATAAEKQRVEADAAEQSKLSEIRRRKLFQLIGAQNISSQIRDLCEQVTQKLPSLPQERRPTVEQWIAWALGEADKLDPLCGDITSWATVELSQADLLSADPRQDARHADNGYMPSPWFPGMKFYHR